MFLTTVRHKRRIYAFLCTAADAAKGCFRIRTAFQVMIISGKFISENKFSGDYLGMLNKSKNNTAGENSADALYFCVNYFFLYSGGSLNL